MMPLCHPGRLNGMDRSRRKIAIAGAVAGCVATILIAVRPREEIADPAVLGKMPLRTLRDSELETLVRAAFRNAQRVVVHGWPTPPATDRQLVISNVVTLGELADNFSIGRDAGQLNPFFCPKLTYTNVIFEGPYRPNFTFTGDQRIYVFEGNEMDVRVKFSRYFADLLGLDNKLP
jgi:hypothetical protein